MKLITKRLTVMSLSPEQMIMFVRDVGDLEKELTIAYHAEPVEGKFRETLKKQARLCEDDENNCLWNTLWMFHHDREFIGFAYFKGLPDKEGDVEITCQINRDYMNQGLTTEAVTKLTEWALKQNDVKGVIADTEKNNFAAHRMLEKCGFEKFRATESSYLWMINSSMFNKRQEAMRNMNLWR